MTNGAVRREDFFVTIRLGKFHRRSGTRALSRILFRGHGSGIETVAAEVAGEPAEISAAEKDRQPVNGNQPDGERFEAGARFAFFPLDRGMHLMDVRGLAVIHPLAPLVSWPALVHFFSSLAATGELAGAGEEAGAGAEVSFASLSS